MKELITAVRKYRDKMLNDPHRPTYHFAIPDDNGLPGDPNGAFFADGVYHLMYLYRNSSTDAFHWGHISSVDLLHWRSHPDALTACNDEGCFSGGAFLDDDGRAYLSFWKFRSKDPNGDNGGIAIACADPPYEKWERITPIAIEGSERIWGTVDIEIDGKIRHISCADPGNIWKMNGRYYMQTGNKCVLDAYGRDENSETCYKGDWTDLFVSDDLKEWKFVRRFYDNTHNGDDWPDETEDDMCPSLLPLYDSEENGKLTDKYLQLFISHNKGCQYYIGTLNGEQFIPEQHGRMSRKDNAFFAPEALIDDKNRQIMWAWLLDDPKDCFARYGWSGVYSFPRNVWLENNQLHMAPVSELSALEYNNKIPVIDDNNVVSVNNGEVFRLRARIDVSADNKFGFSVRCSEDGSIHTDIYYDKESKMLVFDATNSGSDGWRIKEEAPMVLEDNILDMDIFVDKSVVEVYANKKQAICRRVYPEVKAEIVRLIGEKSAVTEIEVSDMAPTNLY